MKSGIPKWRPKNTRVSSPGLSNNSDCNPAWDPPDLRVWLWVYSTRISLFSWGIVDGAPCPCWPPSPSAFSVSWKMSPAHWLNFIPSWPGPFCEGAINLALNTTFVYYSGKALMTFMSMITTFFRGERMRKERPKFIVTRRTWAAQII